jgi:hypothetical protein
VGWWRECGCELGFEGRGLRLESIDWWWGLVYCYAVSMGDALGYVHLVYGLVYSWPAANRRQHPLPDHSPK